MKNYLLMAVTFIYINNLKSQAFSYTINGEIKNVNDGKIYLISSGFDKKYYGKNHTIDSAKIFDGKFKIQRIIYDNNPYAYRLLVQSDSLNGTTGLVFIEPKSQIVIIDSVNEHVSPIIQNSNIQKEIRFEFDEYFKDIAAMGNDLNNYIMQVYKAYGKDIPKDELLNFSLMKNKILTRGDSLFFLYSLKHNNSYVTLWKLIERFNNLGYNKEYFEIYNSLSNTIKNSRIGKLLLVDLNLAKTLGLGETFPNLGLKNLAGKTIPINIKDLGEKYTLVNFWFSSCAPCISEFPDFKRLYNEYKPQGFKIIGISVDRKHDFNRWKIIINKKSLNWGQYLDEDGNLSKKLGINSFPTNFLLNKKRKIIQKNISLTELDNYLKNKLDLQGVYDKVEIYEPK